MGEQKQLRIAVIGGGVAGIVASYLLQRKHDITLYESNNYVGGHTQTITVSEGPDRGIPVDTGFIVMNNRTYPLFQRFLSQLAVAIRETEMSFSYTDGKTGLQYASTDLGGIFAQRLNILKPSFWAFLLGIVRFNRVTRKRLHQGSLGGCTLGDYLQREGFRRNVIKEYILPMAGAIWSAPDGKIMDFPAETFARFYENHGLLSITGQPQWYYIPGGSQTYVKAFLRNFSGQHVSSCHVNGIRREEKRVAITLPDGKERFFDRIIIATHADEALQLLSDPSPEELRLLSPWKYSKNLTVLHSDISFLPPNQRAWASWNYVRGAESTDDAPVTLTYDMTHLQRLNTSGRYCVTLNPGRPISLSKTIFKIIYSHPIYDFKSLATQAELKHLNGQRNTYFCGSYFGNGFHEDAVRSAVEVGSLFGIDL